MNIDTFRDRKRLMLRILKLFLLFIMLMMVVVVSFQNLTPIQLKFLFSTIELPQAVILGCTLLLGFLMGLTASALWRVRAWRAKHSRDKRGSAADGLEAHS